MAQTVSQGLIFAICALLATTVTVSADSSDHQVIAANVPTAVDGKSGAADQGGRGEDTQNKDAGKKEKTPEEKMQARFPQSVKVGHLIGLPVLDFDDATIGYVRNVVRTSEGKIRLILPYGKRFGWARDWWPLNIGRRLVAVPIETVAILALQINALDMVRDDFDKAPSWATGQDQALRSDETIEIALARR